MKHKQKSQGYQGIVNIQSCSKSYLLMQLYNWQVGVSGVNGAIFPYRVLCTLFLIQHAHVQTNVKLQSVSPTCSVVHMYTSFVRVTAPGFQNS